MRLITELNADPKQNFKIGLPDGTTVDFTIRYVANQAGWFYTVIREVGNFQVSNRRLVTSPNMLRAFRNVIPFGFALSTSDGQEPIFKDDFVTGRAKLYLLDSADVAAAEAVIHA